MERELTIFGRTCRVECNWNAIMAFLEARGTAELTALSCLESLSAKDATLLMLCCIAEGERLEGREFDFDPEDLKRSNPSEMVGLLSEFLRIYAEQTTAQVPEEDKKKPLTGSPES